MDPLVYAYDSPGVMLPFIGKGDRGAERGVKLALIGPSPQTDEYDVKIYLILDWAAGIKEGLYDVEALATYLLYRLNVLNPIGAVFNQLTHLNSPY